MKRHHHLLAGAAAVALLSAPGLAVAQDVSALEARIAQLEGEIEDLKALVQSVVAAPAPVAAPPPVLTIPVAAAAPAAAPADGFRAGQNTLKFGGFIKGDYILSDYSGGDPANGDLLRDFYLPGSIPVGGADEGVAADFNARQTRLWLTTDSTVGTHRIGGRIEMDFQVLPGTGDQRTTSPANLSLRRAFVTFDNWLVGQEWTNFQNVSVLPETADYVGSTEGTVFARQVQVRYTRGPFSIALENPETTVTPFGGISRIIADDNAVPDVTARYVFSRPWGEASLSGLLRQLAYETTGVGAIDSTATGWGLSAAAKIKVGATDDLRLMISGGEGVGRYLGLNFSNDAVLDASGDLQPIGVVAGFVSYRHVWQPGWRSNLTWSWQQVDNDLALISAGANRSAQSLRANLIWSPAPGFDFGGELMTGSRELENGLSGDLNRLQFFAKYGF